jgi:hypothetical protein
VRFAFAPLSKSEPHPYSPHPHRRSQHYITTSWFDMWNSDVKDIINWGQVVWGNARLSPSGTITCQHGAAECDLNIMQVRSRAPAAPTT